MLRFGFPTLFALVLLRPVAAAEPPQFNAHVRPILKAYCFECHGESEKPKGALDVRLRRLLAAGGDNGPAFVEGKPEESLLLERVISGDMPPGKKKLSAAEIAVLKEWIAAGAKVEAAEPATLAKGFTITDDDRKWWAFQPVVRPPVPAIQNPKSKIENPIDAFLLKKLSDKGVSFAPPAERLTLLRRITFDLVGLPPTPDEADAFLKDMSPNAYEKVVERLLASPQYGERWARHWLDVAGYADSEGGSVEDPVRPTAWKYRDYVIRSFNSDKPFDRFIREQLAGDEMVKPPYPELNPEDLDKLTATGFLRMASDPSGVGGVDQKLARNQTIADTVKIVSSAFLGVTVGCAQCHNHRYDPIPQADFYRLRAVFEPAFNMPAWKPPAAREVSLYTKEEIKMAAAVEAEAKQMDAVRKKKESGYIDATFQKELAKLPIEMRGKASEARKTPDAKRTAEQKKLMQEHPSLNVDSGSLYLYDSKAAADLKKDADAIAKMRSKKPVEQFIRAMTETGATPPTFLFSRGDIDQPREKLEPGGLSVVNFELARNAGKGSSGRRTALAEWLVDPRQPLTSRTIVNRIWMHHFGKGLVPTPGDFGRLGEKPTHPELLDWLSAEFMAKGWSVKHLHRLIVTSTAYRQSSARDAAKDTVDADNKLLGRFPLRRLEAESLRDAMLAVSGKLNAKMFGPSVPVVEDENGIIVIGKPNRDAAYRLGDETVPLGEESRRSVYIQVRRSKPLNVLDTFDQAKAEPNCEARNSSTATPQSLLLMNGSFTMQQAGFLADRVKKEAGTDPALQSARAWKLVYGAEMNEKEKAAALAFLTDFPKKDQALAAFCQALLSSNRFLYVD
jgi:hypothetical protein